MTGLPIFDSVCADFAAGLLGDGQPGRHEWRDWQPAPRHSSTGLNAPTIEIPRPRKES